MANSISSDDFKTLQLGWIGALSSPGMYEVQKTIADPGNAAMREGADISSLMAEKAVPLPKNAKTTLVRAAGDEPMGTRICIQLSDDGTGPFHCMTIRSPFTFG